MWKAKTITDELPAVCEFLDSLTYSQAQMAKITSIAVGQDDIFVIFYPADDVISLG